MSHQIWDEAIPLYRRRNEMKKSLTMRAGLLLAGLSAVAVGSAPKLYADVMDPSLGVTSSGPYHHPDLENTTPVIVPNDQPQNTPVVHKKKAVKKHHSTPKKSATPVSQPTPEK
jgi:hypothetical protein